VGVESELADAWIRGVAANVAAPTDALLRLLGPAGRASWEVLCGGRALPDEVVTAIVADAEVAQRRLLARNPHATPEQRGRLALDPDAMVRCDVASGPRRGTWLVQPLPDDVIELFYTAQRRGFPPGLVTEMEILQELAFSWQVRSSYDVSLIAHPDPMLRSHAVLSWSGLTPEQQAALLADPDPDIRKDAERQVEWLDPVLNEARLPDHWTHGRTSMMMRLPMTRAVAEREFDDVDGRVAMAFNPFTPADIVERLARDPDPAMRARIARRLELPADVRSELEQDPDVDVRTTATAFGAATTAVQHWLLYRLTTASSLREAERHACLSDLGDPDWFAQAAESDNVLLRRAAALHPRLPQAQVRRLAADSDEEVRSLLAHSHPDAPADLVIEVFIAEPRNRALLLLRPQMPRTGLAHLLDHADAQVRALAAADVTLPEPPVAMLDDADEQVRRAAAANRLLPADAVERLLQDPRHAEGAAANPRLGAETLHGLLDAAGVPR